MFQLLKVFHFKAFQIFNKRKIIENFQGKALATVNTRISWSSWLSSGTAFCLRSLVTECFFYHNGAAAGWLQGLLGLSVICFSDSVSYLC